MTTASLTRSWKRHPLTSLDGHLGFEESYDEGVLGTKKSVGEGGEESVEGDLNAGAGYGLRGGRIESLGEFPLQEWV